VPVYDLTGPHVRLGVVWAALLVAALFAGAGWLAVVLAPVAGLAAVQASRSWRKVDTPRPIDGMAGAGAVVLVASAVFGLVGLAVGALVLVAAAAALHRIVLARHRAGQLRGMRSLGRTLALALVPGLAAAAPVALRGISSHGSVVTLALCTYALVYDASAFLVGAGSRRVWEGPVAGVASIAAVTVAVAAILVPPFSGARPWILGVAAVILTPLGPVVATILLGDRRARVPALRRLDSLMVLGPVWTLLALVFVA
jgi:hypothetical protein